jgi:hypothetical protein
MKFGAPVGPISLLSQPGNIGSYMSFSGFWEGFVERPGDAAD